MTNAEFNAYKSTFLTAIHSVLADSPPRSLDEAAFPAYAHSNPLISWLFWQRLKKTMDYIQRHAPYHAILDFGCGSGVMLPFLCQLADRVGAVDVDLVPFDRMRTKLDFPDNLDIYDANKVKLEDWPPATYDLITALDVLEHVPDLAGTVSSLLRLLNTSGRLVVSGPTENIFYKIGRRLSGPEYTGAYHARSINDIKWELGSQARIEFISSLYRPVPLFEIFAGRKA